MKPLTKLCYVNRQFFSELYTCFFLTAFIILYRDKDESTHLFDGKIKDWWDFGPQKELQRFAEAQQLISLRQQLNEKQKEAIRKFLGCEV